MALLSALLNNNVENVEEALNSKDTTSEDMKNNIKECFEVFFDGKKQTEDNCQRIPCLIINKLVKTMFCEYTARSDDENIKKVLFELDKVKKKTMHSVFLGGECLLKPVIKKDGFSFLPVRRDCFIPLGRDVDGTITCVGMVEATIFNGHYYTLLEKRTAGEELVIETRLYASDDKYSLGHRVPLNTLSKYKDIVEYLTLPVCGLGLVQLKTPIQNCVDTSNDGVCIYAPALGLIKNINRNEQQLNDEFDLGQSRIIISRDMLKQEGNKLHLVDKVFTAVEDVTGDGSTGITIFNPNLREQSYINRRNEYLKSIESLIGFRRGLLSNVEAVEKTATEITSTAGEYNLTIIDIQEIWENAVKEALEICSELGAVYNNISLKPDDNKIIISWGDGVLYNRSSVFEEMLEMVRAKVLRPEMLISWYYDLPNSTEADLEKIKKLYIPEEVEKAEQPIGHINNKGENGDNKNS